MDIKLHEKQQEVLDARERFLVFAAGRRSGKTYLAAVWLFIQAMMDDRKGPDYGPSAKVLYVAPTIGMADDLMTDLFSELAADFIQSFNVKKLEFTMTNGRKVKLAGCDKPRSLRGGSIIALVMDEVQDVDINKVWNRVLRPACGDLKAPCLFIGTPLPGASEDWHDLYRMGKNKAHKQWNSVHCNSTDNPFIDMAAEVAQAREDGVSEAIIQQEYFANFKMQNASHFKTEAMPVYMAVPEQTRTYISVDLAGFGSLEGLTAGEANKLDETAISAVSVCDKGNWYIRTISHGKWGVEETATEIARLCQVYEPQKLGIEKGALYNAILPYLDQALESARVYPLIVPMTHGGKKKVDRIFWGLQGRLEKGKIHIPSGSPSWHPVLVTQLLAIPSRYTHDDLADSLSYIDQIADATLTLNDGSPWEDEAEDFEPLDIEAGY